MSGFKAFQPHTDPQATTVVETRWHIDRPPTAATSSAATCTAAPKHAAQCLVLSLQQRKLLLEVLDLPASRMHAVALQHFLSRPPLT